MDSIFNLIELADRLYSLCQTVKANKEQRGRLAEMVISLKKVLSILQEQDPSHTPPQALEEHLVELQTCFRDAEELLNKYGNTSCLGRVFKAKAMEEDFEDLFQRLDDVRQLLSLSLQVEQRGEVHSVHDVVDRAEQKIDLLHEKMDKLIVKGKEVKGPETPSPAASPQDADKLLGDIRGRFVEKASLPLIKQLLDGLQQERVLNSEEAEAVLEEQAARADRARCLIDMVRKKGRRASEKMITLLRERDPNLGMTLGLA
ncbi:uncharacterized protein LOC105904240 [Clupea harengus]|uniref:Uncharacterized protein LOC105904240 n=1 Tax=Clupea harengus TaxID=7950 RepID=A0A6P8ERR4_CLUHA|nr:uncharacterized protein LOC105904240 [Clupea harengus]XP_031418829.1 uncharacterized protein LOC105904240 [Clupea harengus]